MSIRNCGLKEDDGLENSLMQTTMTVTHNNTSQSDSKMRKLTDSTSKSELERLLTVGRKEFYSCKRVRKQPSTARGL